MSLFLTILTVLAVIILVLEVRRRIRKASGRLGRPRNAASGRAGAGLSIDRQPLRTSGRKKPSRLSPLAGPVVVGLVFIFMGAWLAFSYFMPDAETTAAVPTTPTVQPPPLTTTRALGGRITIGGEPEAASSGAAAVLGTDNSPKPAPTLVTDAARSIIGSYSQMDQVGLLPARVKARPAAVAKAPESVSQSKTQPSKAAQSKKGPQSKSAQAVAVASKPERPAETAAPKTEAFQPAAVASSSLVGAASGAGNGTSRPAGRDDSLLGGGRDFTVHLSSFRDQDNAEKYRSKLAAAGEQAYITETTVNGQHWYRVMSGRFKSRASAENYGRDLRRRDLTADTGQYMIKPVD